MKFNFFNDKKDTEEHHGEITVSIAHVCPRCGVAISVENLSTICQDSLCPQKEKDNG